MYPLPSTPHCPGQEKLPWPTCNEKDSQSPETHYPKGTGSPSSCVGQGLQAGLSKPIRLRTNPRANQASWFSGTEINPDAEKCGTYSDYMPSSYPWLSQCPCPEKQSMLGQSWANPQILTDSSEKLQINLSNREMVPKARICSCILSDIISHGKMICRRDREDHQHGGGGTALPS